MKNLLNIIPLIFVFNTAISSADGIALVPVSPAPVDPTPAPVVTTPAVQVNTTPGPTVVFEAVLEVHWSNGIQTHHEFFGPIPGDGESFNPTPNWYVALRGATAHAKFFNFDLPTIPADRVVWRMVIVPQQTQFRLVFAPVPPGVIPHPPATEVAVMSPCEESHPINQPRNQEVDITQAFNTFVQARQIVNVHWEVRQAPPEALNCTPTIIN